MKEEKLSFGADVSRLLDIVAHALYSNQDVFLRELVSNAADACDRLRYEAIKNPALLGKNSSFRIDVGKDAGKRTVTVADNGIGMTRQELVDNLGTIARSGTAALMKNLGDGQGKPNLIGQFGVGFYASFMVADRVEVVSRKAGEKETWHWESDGRTGFSVREASKDEAALLGDGRGTTVMLHINDRGSEFLIDEKLTQVIQTWSDHVGFPIHVGNSDEPVNKASALWVRPKNDITKEEYNEFYKHITHGVDEPLMTSHWKAEGAMEYTALLYVPTLRPWDLYDPTRKHVVKLYVKRMFIADDCEGLVYPWLRFLRGIIDSADLPLNISREMLQHNPVVAKIRSSVARRVLNDLDRLSREDWLTFCNLYNQFGPVLKEGLYDAFDHRDELLKVVRFYSTHQETELTSLSDYVSRMKDGQDKIFYISGENLDTLRNSPQIEGFRDRGLEVLFFTDTIDDFWLQSIPEYNGKIFQSVTKGDIDLSCFQPTDASKKQAAKENVSGKEQERFMSLMQEALKDEVGAVRMTSRLSGSPVCLVAADNEIDLRMERVLRIHQKYEAPSKRVLEVNPDHPLIRKLIAMTEQGGGMEMLPDAAHLLLDQARIIQGEPVPDPSSFSRRVSLFMERGLAA